MPELQHSSPAHMFATVTQLLLVVHSISGWASDLLDLFSSGALESTTLDAVTVMLCGMSTLTAERHPIVAMFWFRTLPVFDLTLDGFRFALGALLPAHTLTGRCFRALPRQMCCAL